MSCTNKFNKHGTILATACTKDSFYLFSDGRVVNLIDNKIINDTTCKIFKITGKTAMLTAGVELDDLPIQTRLISKANKFIYANDVARVVNEYFLVRSNFLKSHFDFKKYVIFVIICGYDSLSSPKEYLFNSTTSIPFQISEHHIQTPLDLLSVGASNGNSFSQNVNAVDTGKSEVLASEFLRKAFDRMKEVESFHNTNVGGKTSQYILSRTSFRRVGY